MGQGVADEREKRSSQPGAGVDELPDLHLVGGRHGLSPAAIGGGGYLGNRGASMSHMADAAARDPRLAELERMGIARTHLRVAAEIGVDAFLTMWRIYDEDPAYRTDKGDLQITMRSYRAYLRFQRNRFIEALHASGKSVTEILARVKLELCEQVSKRHVYRLRK